MIGGDALLPACSSWLELPMNLSGPFIRRPVATMLLSLAIMLLGA